MDIHLVRRVIGTSNVLDVSGELDLSTVPRLHDELMRLVTDSVGDVVVVDLDGVDSFDDTALGVVLGAAGRAREAGGDLVVVCSDPRRLTRWALNGFDRAVTVVGSITDGITP